LHGEREKFREKYGILELITHVRKTLKNIIILKNIIV
jgi:hypothetical protein